MHAPRSASPHQAARLACARLWLKRAMQACAASVVFGQLLFAAFIVAFYFTRTLSGDIAAWNDKDIITGFVPGDRLGNLGFGLHVMLAGLVTGAGLIQILPLVRQRSPRLHRWSGRFYVIAIMVLALGGLAITWVRGSYLTIPGAVGISLNAVLLLAFAALAWRNAWHKAYAAHRRWALRLFVVAGAVWFMRLGYIGWGISTGGVGIGEALDGPFDIFLAYANSLVPLLVIELYFRAETAARPAPAYAMAAFLALCALAIALASVGTWLVTWAPHL